MSRCPDNWAETTLGAVNTFVSRTIDPSKYPDEVFELYSVPAFPTRRPEFLAGSAIGSTKQLVAPGDVLVSKINPRINRVWEVGPSGTRRQIASSEWIVLRAPTAYAPYLRHYCSSPAFREMICAEVSGVGGSLTRAQPKRVATLPVPLAPLDEQKRIADKLDALLARVDACGERLDRVPSLLKHFRQSVLLQAVTGRLTADWRQERRRVDRQWKKIPLGRIVSGIQAGVNVKCEERPPDNGERGLVKISAVTWGTYNDEESKTLPRERGIPEETRIRVGDFLISRANTIDLVGACVLVEKVRRPVFLSDKILRLVMPDEFKRWVMYVLRSEVGRRQIESLASGNQLSMRNLSQASLRSIVVPVPASDEIAEIERRVEALWGGATRLEARCADARRQVQGVVPSLFTEAFRGTLVAGEMAGR